MLEGLDEIEWDKFENIVYTQDGKFADRLIPNFIRNLASEDRSVSEYAVDFLFSVIWHQGMVFETTAFAIPFLIELLTYEAVQNKADILYLLSSTYCTPNDLKSGYPYYKTINANLRAGRELYAKLSKSDDSKTSQEAQRLIRLLNEDNKC